MTPSKSLTVADTTTGEAATTTAQTVAAPRLTRAATAAVVVGVLVQATLAGGFLAGRSAFAAAHMVVAAILVVTAVVVLAGGLIRRSNPEPTGVLATRIALLASLVTTSIAGMAAGGGTRDLLMVHIPMAFIIIGVAGRLYRASRTTPTRRTS